MARENMIGEPKAKEVVQPFKDSVDEFREYMKTVTESKQHLEEKLAGVGKAFIIIKAYLNTKEFSHDYYTSLIISDINSCFYCLKYKLPKRYFYFSLRSLIEAFLRANLSNDEEKRVSEIFEIFKIENQDFLNSLDMENAFGLLKENYSNSSKYIHGDKKVDFQIRESIEELNREVEEEELTEMLNRVESLIKIIKKFYIVKDEKLSILRHNFRFKMPVINYLLTTSELKQLEI